jgi:hypothetical protein
VSAAQRGRRGLIGKRRALIRRLAGGTDLSGMKVIRENETYRASAPAVRSPEVLVTPPEVDIDIKIPEFGPISDHTPEESPAPPRA